MPAIELNSNFLYGKTILLRGFAEFVSWKNIKNSSEMRSKCMVNDIFDYIMQIIMIQLHGMEIYINLIHLLI